MKISINQPSFMPWCGYFDYIHKSDTFVYFDDVQFSTTGWAHRNRIKIHNGQTMWLTVPIVKSDHFNEIRSVRINYREDWSKKHINSITTYYARAPWFVHYKDRFFAILEKRHHLLSEMDWELLMFYCECLDIRTKILKSSELGIGGKGVERVIAICKALGATHYYASGVTSRHLYNPADFEAVGIALEYQDYVHPVYPQLWGGFVPYIGIMDLLFNVGSASKAFYKKAAPERVVDLKSEESFLEQYVSLRNEHFEKLLSSPVTIDGTRQWLRDADIEVRGITLDNRLLGAAILYLHRGGEIAFFTAAHGKGYGTKLLDIIESVARGKGMSSVWAWVLEDNAVARHVFEKCGFTVEKYMEREYNGAIKQGVEYRKKLN